MSDFPAVNGYHPSWAAIEIKHGGDISRYIKEITYNDSRDRGIGRGTTGRKTIRTQGDDEPEASVVFYRKGFNEFVATHGEGFGDKELDWTVSYVDGDGTVVTDTLRRAVFDNLEGGGSEGPDPTEVPIDLNIMQILWNGVSWRKNVGT